MPKKVTYKEVKEFVENSTNYKLLGNSHEGYYNEMEIQCNCGEVFLKMIIFYLVTFTETMIVK